MQQAEVAPAPAPAPAPAEDFEGQIVEESNQRGDAISTCAWTARECLGTQACSSDHDAPDLKGQPVKIIHFFRPHLKGKSRAVVRVKGIEE